MSISIHQDVMRAHIRVFNLRNLVRIDRVMLLLIFALALVGIFTLMSANRSFSGLSAYYMKQMIFFGLGAVACAMIACIDHRFIVSLAPLLYAGSIGLLIAVLIVGAEIKGGQRWLSIGPFGGQPSEPAKLALILMLTWYFTAIGPRIRKMRYVLLTFIIAAIPGLLILREPNLGTAATLGPVVFAMLYVAGCKRRHLIAIVLAGLAAAPVAWTQLKDYQQTRVITFIDPARDPQGSGYHTIQSMITVGSGGLTGKGYMEGTQTYLSYLPEHHTDFIFSLLAEEWGFVGACGVIIIFALFLTRALSYAHNSIDLSGSLLVTGVVSLLAFHVFVNIAITLGMMPVTGIPLPFLSYGGSFYLTTMMSVGVLFSVNARRGIFD
ncbi:MAG: rod shape-determining protein RodA [Candidatus Hydrogenedentes bacterium]|nr:rod shape-determining protein RodA [Candidatus Hydrogenedentota bacterium]